MQPEQQGGERGARAGDPGRQRRYLGERYALGDEPYVADLARPGMLFGAVRLADHPRAKLIEIDASAALALPSVRGLVLGRTMLYPADDDVAKAVDTAVGLVR